MAMRVCAYELRKGDVVSYKGRWREIHKAKEDKQAGTVTFKLAGVPDPVTTDRAWGWKQR